MSNREGMSRALQDYVVPLLRERRFSGTLPHFRRQTPGKTDLLTFQFDRHGGGFVIEIAEAAPGEFVTSWKKAIPANRLTALNVNPPIRKRLKPGSGRSTDDWFRYDGDRSPDDVAHAVAKFLPQIDSWFAGEKGQPNIR
jgi:hypothetical protein